MSELIWQPVTLIWKSYSAPMEGYIRHMYLDVKGLVTTGVGNLLRTRLDALQLPWQRADGLHASTAEIVAEWERMKAATHLAAAGHIAARKVATLFLTDEAIDALVASRLRSNSAHLTNQFPEFPAWPADAQLGTLSMAWAAGSSLTTTFPKWSEAARSMDWITCAYECRLREQGNPGVAPRNKAQRLCFENAYAVGVNKTDPAVLHWPARYAPWTQRPDVSADAVATAQLPMERDIDAEI